MLKIRNSNVGLQCLGFHGTLSLLNSGWERNWNYLKKKLKIILYFFI